MSFLPSIISSNAPLSTPPAGGVDRGALEEMMEGRKLINGVSDENNETIDSSISDNVDFYSDR